MEAAIKEGILEKLPPVLNVEGWIKICQEAMGGTAEG